MTAAGLQIAPESGRLRLMTISNAVDLYLGELARQGRAPKTLASYQRTLDKLADMYPHHDVEDLTATMVRRFLDTYRFNAKSGGNVPNSPTTIGQRITHVDCFFEWLHGEELIPRVPSERIKRPKKQSAVENDNVVTISSEDGRLLLLAAREMPWPERIALNVALLTGARREALAQLRRSDYDPFGRTLTFHEKGSKTIVKPCPDPLASVLDAAIFAGIYQEDDDYLIPSLAQQRRPGPRDPRIVSRLVARVAKKAGVKTHVHALRAAFAVSFLEEMGTDHLFALQQLLGHARGETTNVYLRRLDRRRSMETVRGFTFGLESAEVFEANDVAEKEGFEPSFHAKPHGNRAGIHRETPDHDSRLVGGGE